MPKDHDDHCLIVSDNVDEYGRDVFVRLCCVSQSEHHVYRSPQRDVYHNCIAAGMLYAQLEHFQSHNCLLMLISGLSLYGCLDPFPS